MNTFGMGERPVFRSEAAEIHRADIDAEVDAAVSEIHEPIDVAGEIANVTDSLIRAEGNAERHRLTIRRAALLKYQESLRAPKSSSPSGVSGVILNLSPEMQRDYDEQGLRQLHNDDRPVKRFGRLRPPKNIAPDVTAVQPMRPPASETYIDDIGSAAM